jgi:hypothetical protein
VTQHEPEGQRISHLAVMRYGLPYPACQPNDVKRYWWVFVEPADVTCPDCLALIRAGFQPESTGVVT